MKPMRLNDAPMFIVNPEPDLEPGKDTRVDWGCQADFYRLASLSLTTIIRTIRLTATKGPSTEASGLFYPAGAVNRKN
jgi:hypothetical protein